MVKRGERRVDGRPEAGPLSVLVLVQYYAPHRTGLTRHAQQLAETLAAQGSTVRVITARHDTDFPRRATERGVFVRRLWAPIRVSRGMIMPFHPFAVFAALGKADVVSVHTPMLETAIVAVVARLRRVPCVITHHGDLVLPPDRAGRFIEAFVRRLHRFAMRLTTAAIAYSDDYAQHSTFLAGFLDRTSVITPPISIPEPDPAGVAATRASLSPGGGPLIGFAGRFVREKRPDVALDAMDTIVQEHPEAVLTFAGEHQIRYEDTWQQLAGVVDRHAHHVNFLGLIEDPQRLADFYGACDVLLLTSDTECFGLVQVEAMLCGTPVVMTDIPGGRVPVQRTGMGELAVPGDPVAVGRAVLRVLARPEVYLRSRQEIDDALGLSHTLARYEEVLRGAAHR